MTDREPEDEQRRAAVEALCNQAFGTHVDVGGLCDVNRGRGAFSLVLRAELSWAGARAAQAPGGPRSSERPASVVAKLPIPGPNGRAAIASGAYRREALAYRIVLPRSPVAHPAAHWIAEPGDGSASFLLEDLGRHRSVDQLDGLGPADAVAVAQSLARFHRAWADPADLDGLEVRRNTVATLSPAMLRSGLDCLATRWEATIGATEREPFARLVDGQDRLAERIRAEPATLCHGDPRADNLFIDRDDGRVILFDWQQLAIQMGEADLAWLAATSLTADVRRRIEPDLLAAADGRRDRYRLGLALPGLAVLLLAQRELRSDRARRFVAVSLQRIAAALADNETAELA